MPPRMRAFWAAGAAFVALDQLTKYLVRAYIPVRSPGITIIPNWLSISHAINPGAAFSFMADFPYRLHVFFALTVISVGVLALSILALKKEDRILPAALGVLMAGVVGNAIDRAVFGEVTDMIMVYAGSEPLKSFFVQKYGGYIFPIFNIADSAIWIGVIGFVLGLVWTATRPGQDAAPTEQETAGSRPTLE